MAGKLTDKQIDRAKATDKEDFLSDGGGLYLRIRKGGKYWLYRFKQGDSTRWLDLSAYPDMSLSSARAEAARLTMDRRRGIEPKTERQAAEEARQAEASAKQAHEAEHKRAEAVAAARITVTDLFDRWEAVVLTSRKDGGKEMRRLFEKDVLPTLGSMAVEDVKKGHITGVTDALLARGVNRLAKLTFASIRQMFRFAQDRDIIEADPTASIRKTAIGGKVVERDRVLSEAEIRELKQVIPNANLTPSTERAIWICLATGCRIGELLQARWEHLDLPTGTWRIPEENSKNQRAHKVFLSAFAMEQFTALKIFNGTGAWCYPNRDGSDHVCPKTITVQLGDRQRPARDALSKRVAATTALVLSGGRWTPHDLRRTAATMMVMLGALPEVAERCLNHVEENRIKRTYQRHSYEPEMRDAWKLLGDRLEFLTLIVAGGTPPNMQNAT